MYVVTDLYLAFDVQHVGLAGKGIYRARKKGQLTWLSERRLLNIAELFFLRWQCLSRSAQGRVNGKGSGGEGLQDSET